MLKNKYIVRSQYSAVLNILPERKLKLQIQMQLGSKCFMFLILELLLLLGDITY